MPDRSLRKTELENLPETTCALKLAQQHDNEDADPLALMRGTHSILSVLDGMGGASSETLTLDGKEVTGAYLAAHGLQEALIKLLRSDSCRDILLARTPALAVRALESTFIETLEMLNQRHPTQSDIKFGNMTKRFGTTFSMLHTFPFRSGKHGLRLFWSGDSPIIIITNDGITTTWKPGAGDAVMGDQAINLNSVHLSNASFTAEPNEPFIAAVATDGLLKWHDGFGGLLELLKVVHDAGPGANTDEVIRRKWTSRTPQEGDDATMSLFMRGQLQSFPGRSAIKTIYPE